MKEKTGVKGFTTLILLLVIVGLLFYTYLGNRKDKLPEETTASEAQQLLAYDFDNNYPKTPRETVKLHCDYLKNAYSDKFSEDDLFVVNQKIRNLLDDELLEINSADDQLKKMKDEIALYKENKQKFISYSLPENSQIQKNTQDGVEYAKLKVTMVIKAGSSSTPVDQEYILRKNDEGQWKILGWQAVTKEATIKEGTEQNE